jgi:DUF4097 and DUF4098 domain-containing protein YvlB
MKRILWLAPALSLTVLAQERSAITREGKYWVDAVTGSAAVRETVRAATEGAVSVQGISGAKTVTYTLKRRAKAATETEARALFDLIRLKTSEQGGKTMLEVFVSKRGRATAELKLSVPRRLRETTIETGGGAITASDLDGAFRAETGGGPIEVNRVQGAVSVRTGGGAVHLGRIGGKLECYSTGGPITAESLGAEAGLNTGGGEIVVRDAKAPVRARTAGGSIRIERAARGVQVAAGAGLIDIVEAGGPVAVETGSGSIKVRSSVNVRCQSGSGTIRLEAVSGAVHADAGAGNIVAGFSGARKLEDSALRTNRGDITVLIPSNLAVTVEATNNTPGAQRIVSDFQEIRPRLQEGNSRSEASGSINGGGAVLRLVSSGGTIYLRRQR